MVSVLKVVLTTSNEFFLAKLYIERHREGRAQTSWLRFLESSLLTVPLQACFFRDSGSTGTSIGCVALAFSTGRATPGARPKTLW